MRKFVIFTDSCIDLPAKMADEMKLVVIPLSVKIDDKDYFNYLDEREITFNRFYQMLREHRQTSTSQANPETFLKAMTPVLKEGHDILSISFSSALSGTYQASVIARDELQETFPDQTIITLDSKCGSMGQGLLLYHCYQLQQQGKTIEEIAQWVEDHKLKICHLFTVADLNHLKRGGRLSSSKALLGTILRIKPILHINLEGKLVQLDKTRGRRSALDFMVDRMVATIEQPEGQTIFISHGDCIEDVEYVKEEIKRKLPITEFRVNYVGPVIGSHSGVGTLAIFYMGNERAES